MTVTAIRDRREPAKGPYARVPYCNQHRTYTKGCDKCRRYGAWHKRIRTRRIENGERITVPADEVRTHLAKLTTAGMTPKAISEASGVPRSTLKGPLYKNTGVVAGRVAKKLLAVPVPGSPVEPPPLSHVTDATGTVRRIRALARLGWTYRHIADAAQTSHRIEHYAGQKWVTHEVAASIARAYDLLSMTPGPSVRTAGRAARAGWAPPLAWDDIDDPSEQPRLDAPDQGGYDETTVAQAVDGYLTHEQLTHRPDLVETIRRLARRGMTDYEIAHFLHWPGAGIHVGSEERRTRGQAAVLQIRARHGIPAPERPTLPIEHDSTRRRRALRAATQQRQAA